MQDRILGVFRGEKPSVMPWFPDLGYWYDASLRRGDLPERYRGDGVVELYRDLRCGCHEQAAGSPWTVEWDDVEVLTETRTDSAGDPTLVKTVWRTPIGALEEIREWEPLSFSWASRKYPVETPDDLRLFRFVYSHQRFAPDFSTQIENTRLWGETGVVSSLAPRSPMASLYVTWMGVMHLSYALSDARREIDETIDVMGAVEDQIYDVIDQSPASLVYLPDNITAQVTSPRLFDAYYAPYYRRRAPGLHAAAKHLVVRVGASFRSLLPNLATTGVDCVQSLAPAPVGDVEISEIRDLAGPDLIVWTGAPSVMFGPHYSEIALTDTVMDYIRHHKEGARFILGICDQMLPDGLIDRVRLVSDLVEEYGRY